MRNNATDIKHILANIDLARANITSSDNVKIVVLISGSENDRRYWEERLKRTSPHIFAKDGSVRILSLCEKTDKKERAGNFLGTLSAYSRMKKELAASGVDLKDTVTLIGMIFGRGERMSPFTQIEGGCKPAIASTAANFEIDNTKIPLSEIEESLMFFSPVAGYLEKRGFRGVLDKWGDETEIPSIDLGCIPGDENILKTCDIIKFISVVEITETRAKEKDWVAYNEVGNILTQVSRSDKKTVISGLKKSGAGSRAGISLGPVAVSYDVLDIALEVFADEIKKPGVYFDFDPYLLKAFAFKGDRAKWDAALMGDKALLSLAGPDGMVPDLFEKVCKVRETFRDKYGRELNLKTLDLGSDIFWLDMGQHDHLREKYLSLNDKSSSGTIARRIENIPDKRDENGNIIANSRIALGISVKDSVIINSNIDGTGTITNSVIKDSTLGDVEITGSFVVLSHRTGRTVMKKHSGIYRSLGSKLDELVLEEGMRHGTLLTDDGPVGMLVSETTDLRDKKNTYDVPIFGNSMSFMEAYDRMENVSFDELEKRRSEVINQIVNGEW